MSGQIIPNFFIAGAPKAGTDALYYSLREHPQIYMSPIKEPNYFASEICVENFEAGLQPRMRGVERSTKEYLAGDMTKLRFGGLIANWNDYLRLFSGTKDELAVGEGSVCYLWSQTAAAAIASRIPGARILIVLMDPAERAFHQYLKSVSDGTVRHSFRSHLDRAFDNSRSAFGVYHPFLAFGNYTAQVRRYRTAFPAEHLSITLYEDMKANRASWFANILNFLGVDNNFVPRAAEARSHRSIPRFRSLPLRGAQKLAGALLPKGVKSVAKKLIYREANAAQLEPQDRARLVEYYRPDIIELQELIGRDLSAWLA